jgi:hypothetical protein
VAATQAAQSNAASEQRATTGPSEKDAADAEPVGATLTGGSVVSLPGGAIVELVGIGEHPSKGKAWWAPDGSPIDAPYEKAGVQIQPANNEVMREIAMRIIEPPGVSVSKHVTFNSSNGGGRPRDAKGKAIEGLKVSAGGFLPLQQTCTVGISVAVGVWKTETQTGGRRSGATGLANGQAYAFAAAYEQDKATLITIAYAGVDGELRVTAVDAAGKDLIGRSGGVGAANFHQITTTFANVALADIVEFRVQTRPYQNYEVRDISLRPGQLTTPTLVEIKPKQDAKQSD